ncbi:MAG: hypothetical protein V4858_06510 [Pseudomonadota bacterium]
MNVLAINVFKGNLPDQTVFAHPALRSSVEVLNLSGHHSFRSAKNSLKKHRLANLEGAPSVQHMVGPRGNGGFFHWLCSIKNLLNSNLLTKLLAKILAKRQSTLANTGIALPRHFLKTYTHVN